MGNYHALLAKSPAFFAQEAGFTNDFRPPPSWVLDRLAEETITGKFDASPSNVCQSCWMARSVNGVCGCDDD